MCHFDRSERSMSRTRVNSEQSTRFTVTPLPRRPPERSTQTSTMQIHVRDLNFSHSVFGTRYLSKKLTQKRHRDTLTFTPFLSKTQSREGDPTTYDVNEWIEPVYEKTKLYFHYPTTLNSLNHTRVPEPRVQTRVPNGTPKTFTIELFRCLGGHTVPSCTKTSLISPTRVVTIVTSNVCTEVSV